MKVFAFLKLRVFVNDITVEEKGLNLSRHCGHQ